MNKANIELIQKLSKTDVGDGFEAVMSLLDSIDVPNLLGGNSAIKTTMGLTMEGGCHPARALDLLALVRYLVQDYLHMESVCKGYENQLRKVDSELQSVEHERASIQDDFQDACDANATLVAENAELLQLLDDNKSTFEMAAEIVAKRNAKKAKKARKFKSKGKADAEGFEHFQYTTETGVKVNVKAKYMGDGDANP